MNRLKLRSACFLFIALLVFCAATLRDPISCVTAAGSCDADPKWLDLDAPLALFDAPAPKRHDQQGTDCPFYQAAWQVFLYATHPVNSPDGSLAPRFLVSSEFSTIEQTFGTARNGNFPSKRPQFALSLGVKSLQRANSSNPTTDPDIAAGVAQAGSLSPAVDKNGNPVYYAIHFNKMMKDFFAQPDPLKPTLHLLTPNDLQAAQQDPEFKNLEFPSGSIEIKSAWQVVSDTAPPSSSFITKAGVPVLKVQNDSNGQARLVADPAQPPQPRTVALVAIHIVFSLKDHPEFIWSTFEHVDANANPDTAPSAARNPTNPPGPTQFVPSPVNDFLLFKSGTQFADGNKVVTSADVSANFDETRQSFTKTGNTFQTPIYRVYRASKADDNQAIDDEVQAVNDSMTKIFSGAGFHSNNDQRNHYRLVGAVWMDDPRGLGNPAKKLLPDMFIRNTPGQNPDDPAAKVAGEDRLSGTALESFTQFEAALSPDHRGQPNCFFCHDSHSIPDNHNGTILIGSKLNVSHIVSRYLLDAPSPVPSTPPTH